MNKMLIFVPKDQNILVSIHIYIMARFFGRRPVKVLMKKSLAL